LKPLGALADADDDFDYQGVLRRKRERRAAPGTGGIESGVADLGQTQEQVEATRVAKLTASLRAQVQSPIQKRLNKLRFATPNVSSRTNQRLNDAPDAASQTSRLARGSEVADLPQLPAIDFSRINRLRVQHKWNGTGRGLREDLISLGGASKFYRTKRQNMMINKPFSMFEGTHLQTSSRAHEIRDPNKTTVGLLEDLDTSFCEKYDEPGVSGARLRTISQNHESIIHQDFDYTYLNLIEGTSAMNIRRKSHFTEAINHLNNPNKLISD